MQAWDALRRPIWLFDPAALRGLYANPAALDLWDADSLDELLSRDFSQLTPAVLARIARLAQATAGGEEVTERWTFYPNGRPVTVQAVISTHRLADGRAALLFEAAPTEVEAGERRAVEALRHTSTLISLFDGDGQPIFANPAAFAAYGSAEHPFEARFAAPEQGLRIRAQALAGETVAEVCEALTLAGRRWHHLDLRRVQDPVTGSAGLLLNERDVTERVEAELGRAAAEQKAAMAEARQKFLTDMSHELRTPLNAVIGFSELLRAGLREAEPSEQAGRIHDAGQRLLSVVNEMIRLSELDGWTGERAAAEPPAPSLEAPTPDAEAATGLRVLYVDDNESNRSLVTAVLKTQGIACQTAADGEAGVAAAQAGGWSLILMDIQMPGMDGIEAARAIRALPGAAGAAPILAVTANTLLEQLAAYAAAGMDDCIAKPINMVELIGKVVAWSEAASDPSSDGANGSRARAGNLR